MYSNPTPLVFETRDRDHSNRPQDRDGPAAQEGCCADSSRMYGCSPQTPKLAIPAIPPQLLLNIGIPPQHP